MKWSPKKSKLPHIASWIGTGPARRSASDGRLLATGASPGAVNAADPLPSDIPPDTPLAADLEEISVILDIPASVSGPSSRSTTSPDDVKRAQHHIASTNQYPMRTVTK